MKSAVLKAGHLPTLIACFLYFDLSFMVWVLLGPMAVLIAADLNLDPGQKGLMVAVPTLAGACLRIVNGVLVGQIGPRRTGLIMQAIVILGLIAAWAVDITSFRPRNASSKMKRRSGAGGVDGARSIRPNGATAPGPVGHIPVTPRPRASAPDATIPPASSGRSTPLHRPASSTDS